MNDPQRPTEQSPKVLSSTVLAEAGLHFGIGSTFAFHSAALTS
jgi:hypothetical protein